MLPSAIVEVRPYFLYAVLFKAADRSYLCNSLIFVTVQSSVKECKYECLSFLRWCILLLT